MLTLVVVARRTERPTKRNGNKWSDSCGRNWSGGTQSRPSARLVHVDPHQVAAAEVVTHIHGRALAQAG